MERSFDANDRKFTDLDQSRIQLEREKQEYYDRLEMTKNRLAEVQDEAMQSKLESGREQALL